MNKYITINALFCDRNATDEKTVRRVNHALLRNIA